MFSKRRWRCEMRHMLHRQNNRSQKTGSMSMFCGTLNVKPLFTFVGWYLRVFACFPVSPSAAKFRWPSNFENFHGFENSIYPVSVCIFMIHICGLRQNTHHFSTLFRIFDLELRFLQHASWNHYCFVREIPKHLCLPIMTSDSQSNSFERNDGVDATNIDKLPKGFAATFYVPRPEQTIVSVERRKIHMKSRTVETWLTEKTSVDNARYLLKFSMWRLYIEHSNHVKTDSNQSEIDCTHASESLSENLIPKKAAICQVKFVQDKSSKHRTA